MRNFQRSIEMNGQKADIAVISIIIIIIINIEYCTTHNKFPNIEQDIKMNWVWNIFKYALITNPIKLNVLFNGFFVILLSVINDKLKSKIEWKTLLNCSSFIIIYLILFSIDSRFGASKPKDQCPKSICMYCGWHTNLFINT